MVHPEDTRPTDSGPALDLIYDKKERLPGHTNGLQFYAYDADGTLLLPPGLLFDRRRLRASARRSWRAAS